MKRLTLIPFDEFKKVITDEVDKLYDDTIREEVLKRPQYSQEPRVIKDQIVDALYALIGRLTLKYPDEDEDEKEEAEYQNAKITPVDNHRSNTSKSKGDLAEPLTPWPRLETT